MKKTLLTLLVAACATTSALAEVTVFPATPKQQGQAVQASVLPANAATLGVKAPAAKAATVVSATPEGTHKVYTRSGISYYLNDWDGKIYQVPQSGWAAVLVFANDGKVWLQSPVQMMNNGTWISGTLSADGKKIVVPSGQVIFSNAQQTVAVTAIVRTQVVQGTDTLLTYVPDTVNSDITYNIADDGTVTLEASDTTASRGIGGMLVGGDNNGSWNGFADFGTTYTPFAEPFVSVPDGLSPVPYAATYLDRTAQYLHPGARTGHQLKVAKSGDELYVQGIGPSFPDAWMKGTVSGGKATFASKQYQGTQNGYFCYFYALDSTVTHFQWGDMVTYKLADNVTFDYNATTGALTNPDRAIDVNAGTDQASYIIQMVAEELKPYTEVAATPADPAINAYGDFYQQEGDLNLMSYISTLDVNGELMNTDKLYYSIYLNDKPFTFTKTAYPNLTADLTEVPYKFTDNDMIGSQGLNVYIKAEGPDSIGVQSIYYGAGERRVSRVVYRVINTSGIAEAHAAATVVAERYYDLTGRRVARPEHGIVIKETIYSDGTRKAVKQLR